MFGRSLSRVSGALFNYKNYLSVIKAPVVSKSALKNQGMSLRVERSGTKQSQGFQRYLQFVT